MASAYPLVWVAIHTLVGRYANTGVRLPKLSQSEH